MYAFGRSRTERMMARNEDQGRANNNPYAQAIYRRFVLPLAELIREDIEVKRAGRRKAHVALLEGMDPEAVAYLAVRNVLNTAIHGNEDGNTGARAVVLAAGKAVYHELMLKLFEHAAPDLFYTLVNDLGRRMSKSERHRMTVFKMQADKQREEAAKRGEAPMPPFPEWGVAGTTQVGSYLVEQLEQLGMVETVQSTVNHIRKHKVRNTIDLRLSPEVLDLIGEIKGHIVETTPYYLPCIEPPKDWVAINDGGFHTKAMRRMQPFAVRSYGSWSDLAEHDLSTPLHAINVLQRTPWRISGRMLDAIRRIAKHLDMEEILSQAEFPAPSKPDWLFGNLTFDTMTPPQQVEFKHWKREKAQWFTDMKLRGTKYGRFYTATTVADKFREFAAIYFVYFADFRGRLYAQTTGVSPQGSDMQKALLEFAEGKPLDSLEAERWFCIHGANKYGEDKCSLDDRVKWVAEHHEHILQVADDPVANSDDWTGADKPLQYLAWCLEYADWRRSPHDFVSRLPIGMDGSCNGLQNFSAMLRDEVGGKATNLVPSDKPNDIYQMVADVTAHKLRRLTPQLVPEEDGSEDTGKAIRRAEATNRYLSLWLSHGINRSLVKRSVMTLPYGSTRFSCVEFIVQDYMKPGKAKEFAKEDYQGAAQFLSHFVWDAIGEVVVKAREAMAWLQGAARRIIGEGGKDIRWIAPSGFPVLQQYQEQDMHRINTSLCGNAKLRLSSDNDTADRDRHRNGIAPNFVHTHDASHMTLCIVAAAVESLSLAMVHDDYGTHAADAGKLYRIIREVFVAMYEKHSPLEEFAALYDLPPPPAAGDLDLRLVLQSPYFFS